MDTRTLFRANVRFEPTDRTVFFPGRARQSTLAAWRRQGLPEGVEWFTYLAEELLGINHPWMYSEINPGLDFRMIPQFEEKILERRESSLVVQDWKGNVCEISDRYAVEYLRAPIDFVTRKWLKCPVESWDDWEAMKARYDPEDPTRFPADWQERCAHLNSQDRVVSLFFNGPFMQLREWLGFENLCMAFLEQPDLITDMLSFWTAFISRMLEKALELLQADYVHVGEDMAYKQKAMISPDLVRRFISPVWSEWADLVYASGCPLLGMDSDGYIGELVPLWIEAGFRMTDPVEIAAGNDVLELRERFGKSIALHGGVDKRTMAKGGAAIRAELERLVPVIREGGFIPSCDHGIPSDVSWPDMVEYSRLLAEITGWL